MTNADARADESPWRANPHVMEAFERRHGARASCREERVPAYRLPDPLLCADGTRIESAEAWEGKRRPGTLDLVQQTIFGRPPGPGGVTFDVASVERAAMDGAATRKQVRVASVQGGRSFSFEAWLFVPNAPRPGGARPPVFLFINNRAAGVDVTRRERTEFWPGEEIVARGYAAAVFRTVDVDPDRDGADARAAGVRGAFAGPGTPGQDQWATISAWAWGASRVMDYLQTDRDVDATRVAVVGHSRGGKTALLAGAQDERFGLIVSNQSGCGGASLLRRRYGAHLGIIREEFPYWFAGNYAAYEGREDEMPIDHHQLLALIAPRGLAVGSADEDLWSDPRGEFLSLAHASPVYQLYGHPAVAPGEMPPLDRPLVRGPLHYHVRPGAHSLARVDWLHYLAHADRLWPGDRGRARSG